MKTIYEDLERSQLFAIPFTLSFVPVSIQLVDWSTRHAVVRDVSAIWRLWNLKYLIHQAPHLADVDCIFAAIVFYQLLQCLEASLTPKSINHFLCACVNFKTATPACCTNDKLHAYY